MNTALYEIDLFGVSIAPKPSGPVAEKFLFSPFEREDLERYLLQAIQQIHEEARKSAEPFIEQLVRLRMGDPPAPIFITKEQAISLKFPGFEDLT